jgi:Tfp pilus assembly protein PilN
VRPIDLTPADERRSHGGSRTGPLAYIVVGVLVALLAGVIVMIVSSNQISERESELTSLQAKEAAAEARADLLAPYAKFQQVKKQRTTTISELADSRFDWPRILRQFSLVMPKYVVVTKLVGAAGAGIGGGEGESGSGGLAGKIKGPSLSIEGCTVNQRRVAAMVAALHQIDGVTRVGLASASEEDSESGSGGGGGSACMEGSVKFTMAAAFDAAPASPDTGEALAAPPAEEASEAGEEASTTETESDSGETTVSKTTTVTPPS